jgi:hypothetical protein
MRAFTHLSVCEQVLVRDSMEKAKTAVEGALHKHRKAVILRSGASQSVAEITDEGQCLMHRRPQTCIVSDCVDILIAIT